MRCASGTRQLREAQARQRVRRDHVDALGDLEARRAGIDDEGRDAARARRFAGAREHDVEVGDAAVGDPGLLAVEHVASSPSTRALQAMRRHVGAGLGLGQREGGDRLAARHARQVALPSAAACPRRLMAPRAQALHREREVGQAGVARQRLADQADGARVDGVAAPPYACRRPRGAASRPRRARARARGRRRRRRGRAACGTCCAAQASSSRASCAVALARRTASRGSACRLMLSCPRSAASAWRRRRRRRA